jgi:hypothetical protein
MDFHPKGEICFEILVSAVMVDRNPPVCFRKTIPIKITMKIIARIVAHALAV